MRRAGLALLPLAAAALVWWALREEPAPGAADAPQGADPRATSDTARDVASQRRTAVAPRSAPRRAAAAEPTAETAGDEPADGAFAVLVVREDGTPVERAAVSLRTEPVVDVDTWVARYRDAPDERRDLTAAASAARPPVLTGTDGRASWPLGATTAWQVVARAEGLALGLEAGEGPAEVRLVLASAADACDLRVRDGTTGRPVAGASVCVPAAAGGGGDHVWLATDGDGGLRVPLREDDPILVVAEGFRPLTFDLAASAALHEIDLTPAAAIVGAVVDAEGAAVVGALAFAEAVIDGAPKVALQTRTDARGVFRLPGGAATGPEARVTVTAEGFAAWRGTARAGDDDLRVVLSRRGVVEGEVVDAAGRRADRFAWHADEFEGGAFRLTEVDPGIAWVGGVAWWGEERRDVGRHVLLRPGQVLTGVRIGPVDEGLSHVRIRVAVPPGTDASELRVVLRLAGEEPLHLRPQPREDGGEGLEVSDALGLPVPPGTRVSVTAEQWSGGVALIESAPLEVVTWTEPPEAPPVLAVEPVLPFEIRAVDRLGDEIDVEFESVEITDGAVRVKSHGYWMASRARFRLRVAAVGFRVYDAVHRASDLRKGVLPVRLEPGASLRFRFEWAHEPVVEPGGCVLRDLPELEVTQGELTRRAFSYQDAGIVVGGLEPGPATLRVLFDGAVFVERDVQVAAGGTDLGVVRIPASARTVLRVTDAKGRPVERFVLLRLDRRDDPVAWDEVEGDPSSVELWLPEGRRVPVRAFAEGRSSGVVWVTGGAAEALPAVRLLPCAHLVLRSGDTPIRWRDAKITARAADGGPDLRLSVSQAKSDDDRSTVPDFPPGRSVVTVTWRGRTTTHEIDAAPGATVEVDVGR